MTTATLPTQSLFLKKKLLPGITPATLCVLAIILLALALHMYNIEAIGDANAYYTAAVQSMLKSWSNFFFVAAEPGGSVTVDKPPLGLWIEAIFAYFLGVSGFSVSLPNIIAGLLSIPLLYGMVKKYAGELAGIVAALVMALTPVFIATNRNNTMDGMLVFTLLLAAWVFMKATETGRARWLMLGAFIVGLGFNIKMMQAFLPLPVFYALYFFGSKEGWLRKIINLGIASVLLVVVSLSWAVAVDLTPADQRPYIGSSEDNTVMSLILGHNGTSRLFGGFYGQGNERQDGQGPSGQTPSSAPQPLDQTQGKSGSTANQGTQPGNRQGPPQEAVDACATESQGATCSFTLLNGNTINGSCTLAPHGSAGVTPPNLDVLACTPAGMIPQNGQSLLGQAPANGRVPTGGPDGQGPNGQGGGTPFSQETGSPGVFRFFINPLSKQMSWLLPFALISIVIALFGARLRLPLESGVHKALLLWGGWLFISVVFFSMISGIFHSYYAIMLVPPLGAMVGIGFAQLWNWGSKKSWVGILLITSAAITVGFQIFASYQYGEKSLWIIFAGILLIAGGMLMFITRRMAYVTILSAMLIIPAYWTVMTITSNPNINLPTAYQGGTQQDDGRGSNVNEELVAYLEANTQGVEYLVAVPSSQTGAPLVLATGRPVLYMGGFGGQDDVANAEDLGTMVKDGVLLYVLYGGDRGSKADITNWLKDSCSVIKQFSEVSSGNQPPQGPNGQVDDQRQMPGNQTMSLYMCR